MVEGDGEDGVALGAADQEGAPERPGHEVERAEGRGRELPLRLRGGEGMGRSAFMPPWGDELTEEQIKDVVIFLRTIKVDVAGK